MVRHGESSKWVADGDLATVSDAALTKEQIHKARAVCDAEEREPGSDSEGTTRTRLRCARLYLRLGTSSILMGAPFKVMANGPSVASEILTPRSSAARPSTGFSSVKLQQIYQRLERSGLAFTSAQ
jgi:hypothetical protein